MRGGARVLKLSYNDCRRRGKTLERHAGETAGSGKPPERHAGETAEGGIHMKYKMDLRLFEEGAAAAGAATGGAEGAASPAGGQGDGAGTNPEGRDLNAEFEALIKGDFKEQYSQNVQRIVKERLKGSKQTESSLKEARELLTLVGERYGQDGSDLKALRAALENDKQYLEQEAIEKGMTVEQLAEFKRMERENRAFKEQQRQAAQQQEFERKFSGWSQEAEALKGEYPALNLMQEFENPQFIRLLDSGVSVKAAYQAVHFDELMGGALQYTAAQAQKKIMDSVRANGARPTENGTKGSGGAREKLDVTKLTKEQRRELAERAIRNPDERITFG